VADITAAALQEAIDELRKSAGQPVVFVPRNPYVLPPPPPGCRWIYRGEGVVELVEALSDERTTTNDER
jgi:hypothetical protein